MRGLSTLLILLLIAPIASAFHQADVSRRAFFQQAAAGATAALVGGATAFLPSSERANAAPEIFTTTKGVKYAILKEPPKNPNYPQKGDIVAIEYTGYLANGQIFDSTHAQGKSNAELFILGGDAVIPGLNNVVEQMAVGEKVQAIIPPDMAFGDKGLCLEGGDCLIKPGATLVYDVFLKKSSIPPP